MSNATDTFSLSVAINTNPFYIVFHLTHSFVDQTASIPIQRTFYLQIEIIENLREQRLIQLRFSFYWCRLSRATKHARVMQFCFPFFFFFLFFGTNAVWWFANKTMLAVVSVNNAIWLYICYVNILTEQVNDLRLDLDGLNQCIGPLRAKENGSVTGLCYQLAYNDACLAVQSAVNCAYLAVLIDSWVQTDLLNTFLTA